MHVRLRHHNSRSLKPKPVIKIFAVELAVAPPYHIIQRRTLELSSRVTVGAIKSAGIPAVSRIAVALSPRTGPSSIGYYAKEGITLS